MDWLQASAGHAHPDANHFTVFGAGEWQIRDDGYAYKWTAQHNTLLIDGRGQIWEGAQWLGRANEGDTRSTPSIIKVESNASVEHIVGDATQAYQPSSGLVRFVRHLFFIKPDVLIIADDIETSGPRDLELRFFPEGQNPRALPDSSFIVNGKRSYLHFQPLTPEGVSVTAEGVPVIDQNNVSKNYMAFRLRLNQTHWRNAVAFNWSWMESNLRSVIMSKSGETWRFTIGKQTVELNWQG